MHTIIWRRLDSPGHEWSHLHVPASGPERSGIAILVHNDEPCRLDYEIRCDPNWVTRSAHVSGSVGEVMVDVEVRRHPDGSWSLNDTIVPAVAGALDVDLAFSPCTNSLPIRRLSLAIGQSAEVRAAWLTFPDFTLEPLDQRYSRTGDRIWHYESHGGAFVRDLLVDEDGVVIEYPGLWMREGAATP
jgi:hypothetical protein